MVLNAGEGVVVAARINRWMRVVEVRIRAMMMMMMNYDVLMVVLS